MFSIIIKPFEWALILMKTTSRVLTVFTLEHFLYVHYLFTTQQGIVLCLYWMKFIHMYSYDVIVEYGKFTHVIVEYILVILRLFLSNEGLLKTDTMKDLLWYFYPSRIYIEN